MIEDSDESRIRHSAQLSEIMDRCRRIETRLTKYLEQQGFDTRVRRPEWDDGDIIVPSLTVSVQDCVSVVPNNWDLAEPIQVVHKGRTLMTLYLNN